ncbi:MAG: hypothetical protein ACM3X7_12530 [Solirubrobacterales bacterium]
MKRKKIMILIIVSIVITAQHSYNSFDFIINNNEAISSFSKGVYCSRF